MQYKTSGTGGFLSSIPPIVKNLIIINALMLLATELFKPFMIEQFALFFPTSPMFKPAQLFTHMFMHGSFLHLFFNMYMLWIFGSALEQYWGSKRFLTYYLITGLGASAFYLLVIWLQMLHAESNFDPETLAWMKEYLNNNHLNMANSVINTGSVSIPDAMPGMADWFSYNITYMVGASGAIYGLLLAFGMTFPDVRLQLLFPPVAMKAKWFVMIFGALELLLGMAQVANDNVAHFAHLGGMLFGIALILYWRKKGGARPY